MGRNTDVEKLLSRLLFQAAWFAAVLRTGKGMPWLGSLILLPDNFMAASQIRWRIDEVFNPATWKAF